MLKEIKHLETPTAPVKEKAPQARPQTTAIIWRNQ